MVLLGLVIMREGRSSSSWAIKMKHNSQKKGPGVEPRPGPNSGVDGEFLYVSDNIPKAVLI
jgi:hypothetical protein